MSHTEDKKGGQGSQITPQPERGFENAEFASRTKQLQILMEAHRLDAILLTTEANFRYFSGFHSQFWRSPTRPWFLIIPMQGKPVAVVPEIGKTVMHNTWLDDIRTWSSPDPYDDGVSLLADLLRSLPGKHGRLGATIGAQSRIRMPFSDFQRLLAELPRMQVIDASDLLHRIRMIKSKSEIKKIRFTCRLTSASFESLADLITTGMSEREICRQMRIDLTRRGIDEIPYLIAVSGQNGYDNIIMGPSDRSVRSGDLLIIDTGSVWDGYYCDFDRNYVFGKCSSEILHANQTLHAAIDAGFRAARPGATTADLWSAMNQVLKQGGSLGNASGRLGHGVGMQLTEPPSISMHDQTVLKPGMVLALEPGMFITPAKQIVNEENIVITRDGADWLSDRANINLPIIG